MRTFRLLKEAEREIRSGFSFYDAQSPGLGGDFAIEVRRLCRRICEYPELGTEVLPDIRRRLVRRFPYSIYYLVEDSEIVVLAIAHQNRKPRYWTSRS